MPYYLAQNDRVAVTPPGKTLSEKGLVDIPADVADALRLRHGQSIDTELAATLRNGEIPKLVSERIKTIAPPVRELGRWEHKVVIISESGGFATAKGVADRINLELDQAAAQGWELSHTTERDNRFVGGESIMLIFRRRHVTEAELVENMKRTELLRRRMLAELDGPSPPAASGFPPPNT